MTKVIHLQAYRASYHPAMPVLTVGVSRAGIDGPMATLEAIIDTGADAPLLPVDVLRQIGARVIDRATLIGITGQGEMVDLYVVTLFVGERRIPGIKAAALPNGDMGILGRDMLNQLHVCLNGPAQVTEIWA